jgi:hypothetical protein
MRTNSIYVSGWKTPNFKTVTFKKVINENLITIRKFYFGPKINSKGSVNHLKYNLGIKVNEIFTFTTPFIDGAKATDYNGHNLSLVVKDDKVLLSMNQGDKSLLIDCWNLEELTDFFALKNLRCRNITKAYISNLISLGRLRVKFNVGIDKNHGTMWKLF